MRTARAILLFAIVLPVCLFAQTGQQKQIVGATEVVEIAEANMRLAARVDTGAETCSIHAVDLQVDGFGEPRGRPISFRIVSRDGQSKRVQARVHSTVLVKSAAGSDRRYKVPLTLVWNGARKSVLVTLKDRSSMAYRLLLGRNWLRGDYLVDVDRNSDD